MPATGTTPIELARNAPRNPPRSASVTRRRVVGMPASISCIAMPCSHGGSGQTTPPDRSKKPMLAIDVSETAPSAAVSSTSS